MSKSRSTIADGYLDSLIPPKEEVHGQSITNFDEENRLLHKKKKSVKQRITVQISEDVIERIKNAVYWTPGLTLAALAEEAFSKIVDSLEEGRKTPFPKRKEELKTGRPLS
ncbi:MAG: hypothetical protein H0V81_13010 [Solirubrobacterales bacterium]|nr:hypothetical protein [Solirubrobacterales bacterium]